jgi:hypothetical protein
MTTPEQQPPGSAPDTDADARFAAWLEDITAGAEDPADGEVCRQILQDDPREQRALFDFVEALTATRPTIYPVPQLAILSLILVATILAVIVVRI